MNTEISQLREEYSKSILLESNMDDNPMEQFNHWIKEAIAAKIKEPNAMILSTSNKKRTSQRTVLLKDLTPDGLTFFTNYKSRKARDIEINPSICVLFPWYDLERQVKIEGIAEKIPREKNEAYFRSRPKSSQLGAWASEQSTELSCREDLEKKMTLLKKQHLNETIPCPPDWGGYLIKPVNWEFWQGRPSRLHDRIEYRMENNVWNKVRLSP